MIAQEEGLAELKLAIVGQGSQERIVLKCNFDFKVYNIITNLIKYEYEIFYQ